MSTVRLRLLKKLDRKTSARTSTVAPTVPPTITRSVVSHEGPVRCGARLLFLVVISLTYVQDESKCGLLAATSLHVHDQRGVENSIAGISRLVGEVKLRGQNGLVRRLYLYVNMPSPSRIQPRHDGFERVAPRIVGKLMAAQPIADIIIHPTIVTMPAVQAPGAGRWASRRPRACRQG